MTLRVYVPLFFTLCLVLAGQDNPQIPLSEGERAVTAGNYAAAVTQMDAAFAIASSVAGDPAVFRSVILRNAEVAVLAGNFDIGDKYARALQGIGGATTEEMLRSQIVLVRCELGRGNLQGAATAANEVSNLLNTHPELKGDGRVNAVAELAEVWRLQGKFAEARQLALQIPKGTLDSPQFSVNVLAGPARIAWSDGRVAEARVLAQAALDARTRVRPADHPDLLALRELLARIAIDDGRMRDAARILNGLSEAARTRLGPAHPFTVDCQLTETIYLARRASYRESETLLGKSNAVADRLPPNSFVRVRLMEVRAAVNLGLRRPDEAARALAQAVQPVPKDVPEMARILNLQAAVAIDQGRLQEAERTLQSAEAVLASRADERQSDRMETRFYSGLLYDKQGDAKRTDDTLGRWIDLRGADASDEPEAIALRIVGHHAVTQKQSARALPLLTRALAIRDEIGGEPDKDLSADYFDMGSALKDSGKLPEANTAFRRSLELIERSGGAGSQTLYTSLSDTLVALGKPAEALPFLEARLRLINRTSAVPTDDTLLLTDQVSSLQFSEKHYQDAEPLLQRLYQAALSGRGPAAKDRSDLLQRLGETETQLNRHAQAVPYFEELARIDLLRKKLSEASDFAEHARDAAQKSQSPASISSALNVLGEVRVAQGKLDDAATLYSQARSTEGADNKTKATSLNGLGRIALNKKQWEEADKLLNEALQAIHADANPSPGLEALVVANLAAAQVATDHSDKATDLYTRFLQLEPQSHPPQDPPLLEQLDEVARFYSMKGRTQDVGDVYSRRLRSSQLIFGDQSLELAVALFNQAEYYRNQKQYDAAIPLYERSASLGDALYGPRSEWSLNVNLSKASVYQAQGKSTDAIQLLEPLAQNADISNRVQADVLEKLAGLYRESGDRAKAAPIYESLANAYAAQGPAHLNPKWQEATKNLIVIDIDTKKEKEAQALLDKTLAKIRSSAGKDTPAQVTLLRAASSAFRKDNRVKDADSLEAKAKKIEQGLGSR